MRKTALLLALLALAGCRQEGAGIWFDGGLEAALSEARGRDTLVMVEFFTDWCNWCRRLDEETLADPRVQRALAAMVALRANAEADGKELATRFGVESYPTVVFVEPDGGEIDRIVGFLPPDSFLERIGRVRAGDTFLSCLEELEHEPGNVDAISRAVDGLLERSDPIGAINRIEAFRRATGDRQLGLFRELMFTARAELHTRAFVRAARLYHRGWDRAFEVPDTLGTSHLAGALASELWLLTADEQGSALRRARFEDAGDLLEISDLETSSAEQLLEIGGFAFRSGHYDAAAAAYRRWYESAGAAAAADDLNEVAWRLYLARSELGLALTMARQAHQQSPTADITDTLARLLYVSGSAEDAVEVQRRAVDLSDGSRRESFESVAERMEAGLPLDDRPSFEDYPGARRVAL